MLQFIKRCLENKEYCMKNFIKLESIRELEAFHERYIFYDGLVKNIHYDISGKSLSLRLECRDRKEQWLILTILISGITLVHLYAPSEGHLDLRQTAWYVLPQTGIMGGRHGT